MSGPTGTHFPGTQAEGFALLGAIEAHCTCTPDANGIKHGECPVHRMLADDQRALDGLVVYRHLREKLEAEEMSDGS